MECIYLLNKIIGEPAAYVGSTIDSDTRFKTYKKGLKNRPIESSITKHGWDAFQKITIQVNASSEKELRLWEGFYIGLFGTHIKENPGFGLNIVRKPELAISKDPIVAKKISDSKKGISMSEEHKQKISIATKGKVHIGTLRPYLGERNKLVKPALGRTGDKHPMSKKVLYIPENKVFESIKDGADYFGITRPALRSRIKYNPNTYKFI